MACCDNSPLLFVLFVLLVHIYERVYMYQHFIYITCSYIHLHKLFQVI